MLSKPVPVTTVVAVVSWTFAPAPDTVDNTISGVSVPRKP
jgi:hypothetical protein